MENKLKLIVNSFGEERFKFNELIKDYTALNIGGPADAFFIVFTTQELIKIITVCRQLKVPFFLIGTGSKIILSDNGFNGLVIKNRSKNISVVSVKGKVTKFGIGVEEALIEADSGISIVKFSEFLSTQKLEFHEFVNMPGSIGGNLFISNVLQSRSKSIKVLSRDGEVEQILPEKLSLKSHVILSAVFNIKAQK